VKGLVSGNDNACTKVAKENLTFGAKPMASFAAFNIWWAKSKAEIQPQSRSMVDRIAVARG
jgi:hypothetical protein